MKRALFAAAGTGVQVGAAMVASAAVVAEVGAGQLGFLRYAIGLVFLLPFAVRSVSLSVAWRDLMPVALIGMGQFGLLIALLNLAVLNTSATRVSMVFATLPLMTLGVGWVIFRTRIGIRALMAILMTIAGVIVLVGGDAWTGVMTGPDRLGLICAAMATLIGALCSTLYKPYLKRYGVMTISLLAMAASLVPLGIMALLEGGGTGVQDWSWHTRAIIVFIGLSSGIGYLLWLYALKHAPAGIVTGFLALNPMTAALLSILLLDTPASLSLLTALILIIGGLGISMQGQQDESGG